jgi:nucleoside-diphosphate kinase
MERTLVLVKPDAVQRGLIGKIISRFEQKGLKISGLKMMYLSDDLLKEHYSHLADKPFFPSIVEFMQRTTVVAMCVEGKEAVSIVRTLCGVTNGREAMPGTIRGDYSSSIQCNTVHASDSTETALVEVPRFFDANELFDYNQQMLHFILGKDEQ